MKFVLDGPTWVAWRFNLTPDSDLTLWYHMRGCDYDDSDTEGHAFVRLHNGGESFTRALRGSGAAAWSPAIDVGVEGHRVRPKANLSAAGLQDGYCSGDFWGGAHAESTDHTLTVLMLSSAPQAWYNISAIWKTGVLSWDVTTGEGVAKRLSEWSHGASASIGGTMPVGSFAALLSETLHTEEVAFGWFLPANVFGDTISSCRQNGNECPGQDFRGEGRWLTGAGPTRWDFEMTTKATVTQEPARTLALFDIPRELAPLVG